MSASEVPASTATCTLNHSRIISLSPYFDGGERYVARLEKVAAMERGMRDA